MKLVEAREVGGVATVTLVVEVDVGSWGGDCTIAQAVKQAQETAVDKLHHLIGQQRGTMRIMRVDHVRVYALAKEQA